ncbi:MAG: type II secretion system protein GspG [Myxococcales bacterium]|nr:type II secretion system protein GspG [Myxococcales bacterium]
MTTANKSAAKKGSARKSTKRFSRWMAKAHKGLTLIEIMIVIAIIAMIGGGVTFAFQQQRRAQKSQAMSDARQIRSIAQMYYNEHREACPTIQSLISAGEMDTRTKTNDPWGKPFSVVCNGDELDVTSNGPDGQAGSADDITTAAARQGN